MPDYYDRCMLSDVYADLQNDIRVGWYIWLFWNNMQWMLEISIYAVDDVGFYTLQEIPNRESNDFEQCIAELPLATRQVLDSVDAALQVVLAAPSGKRVQIEL